MKLTPTERKVFDIIKMHAGRTIQFEAISSHFSDSDALNARKSLMCSVRRLRIKLQNHGNPFQRITKVGRGNKAVFFIDESILKI
jgi:DNA-binding response OmpR family regulator